MRFRTVVLVSALCAGASLLGGRGVAFAQSRHDDAAVRRAFRAAQNREPTSRELRRYARLMGKYEWTEADVRRDLAERSDYQRYSSSGGTPPEVVIRRAYRDILGRQPDAEGLRHYEGRMLKEGWTEQDIRESLRNSPEYSTHGRQQESADRIVRQAYQQILGRDPDAEGLRDYRQAIVEDGWEEHDVRQALSRSRERQQNRGTIDDAQATEMVRRTYRSVLKREPDAAGLREYKARILQDRWTEEQLAKVLRESPEYRDR